MILYLPMHDPSPLFTAYFSMHFSHFPSSVHVTQRTDESVSPLQSVERENTTISLNILSLFSFFLVTYHKSNTKDIQAQVYVDKENLKYIL